MRPLGIPNIKDRLVQQCILQVLEPICEAKFHERSNGFRPNRSAENAIAQAMTMIQQRSLYGNLQIIHIDVHKLIHAKDKEEIQRLLESLQLTEFQIERVNLLRNRCNLFPI